MFRAGKREENGGSRAAVGQGTAKVCMPCLFAWFFFVIRGGYAQRNTFFAGGRGGGSVRRAINRLMPSAPAKIGAVALVVLVVAGVGWAAFSTMRAPAFEVHADEVVAPSSSEPEAVETKAPGVCVRDGRGGKSWSVFVG